MSPGKGSYLLATIYADSGEPAEAVKFLRLHLGSPFKKPSRSILLDESFAALEDSREWRLLWSEEWYSEEEVMMQEIRYLTESGEHLQALEMTDELLAGKPDWDEMFALKGEILYNMGQQQASVTAYTQAIEFGSSRASYYYGRACSYLHQEKYKKAVEDLERAVRLAPERLTLLSETGTVHHKAGNTREAMEYYTRYLEYYPEDAEVHYLAGQVNLDTGDYLDALVRFNECLRIEKNDPRYFAARGRTYLLTSTYRFALNDFGMALDLDPGDPESWYLRGEVQWKMNRREGAFRDWEKAARLGSFEAVRRLEENNLR
jgi:tetratricopeptide (TPR) repeat protein